MFQRSLNIIRRQLKMDHQHHFSHPHHYSQYCPQHHHHLHHPHHYFQDPFHFVQQLFQVNQHHLMPQQLKKLSTLYSPQRQNEAPSSQEDLQDLRSGYQLEHPAGRNQLRSRE